ncbi:FAD-linked oxidase C-terminal domain-containing protein [Cognatishimia sp. 1_MG-2023]|uniref:FAD-binding oxidoreductase n=1 Tax=Cognatishimia sp. 1_MG-2023 TaxID=3062642 RepID=UPI0026E3AE8C|nr:FAD-linked oxidase C-terminal domain-containing protein [Cognatishimia sp. 1_MG-2023]MDO6726658.1 FAD-linked oxidase C-terminal domain-containing protein [Cognatishimia sp. 1_MG-2023]
MTADQNAAAITALKSLLGDRLSTGQSIRETHSHDEAYSTPVLPDAVAFPQSTAEVSEIMKICHQHKCPVVAYGVGSSLEGHVVPIKGGISLNMMQMNKVLEIHTDDLDAVVQPGVTRTELNTALRDTGLMFTVDPGADATMGGMAATRASGTNSVRYGTMRENVLALEVVTADGTIIRTGSRARKSSAGYDLTHMFIGSEGTLGIITELTVRLFGQPESISAATCVFEDIDNAVNSVIMAIQIGLPMARIELVDEVQIKAINAYNDDFDLPEKPHLFLEFHGSPAGVAEQVETFKDIAEDLGASEFQWATKTEDRTRLWAARHSAYYAAKALRKGASGVVTDCCVPISALAECIAEAKAKIADSDLLSPVVGHVGDGNFHLQILVDPNNTDEVQRAKAVASHLNHLALKHGGTVTGEHGVGTGKLPYMQAEHGEAYTVMATLKRAMDPDNILNPGKIVALN